MKIISFEGFEYSGKSTQIKLLQNYFKKNKIKSSFTREPGGNKQLEKIRKIILQSDFDNLSLILFFFASRFSLLSSMKISFPCFAKFSKRWGIDLKDISAFDSSCALLFETEEHILRLVIAFSLLCFIFLRFSGIN